MGRAQVGLFTTILSAVFGVSRAQCDTSLFFVLKGNVFARHTGAAIQGAEVKVTGTNGDRFSALTDTNGGFVFIGDRERYIAQGVGYDIQVTKECYLHLKDKTSTVGLSESTVILKEYYLSPVMDCGGGRWSPIIEFKQNSSKLGSDQDSVLMELRSVLLENPGLVLELTGHADGDEKESIGLKRSGAVRDHLMAQGIDASRLIAISKGCSNPRITEETISRMLNADEQASARAYNRRVEIKVIRTDWRP